MFELDVCIEPVFCDLDYEERIRRVAGAGYKSVEFWFHDHMFDGHDLIPQEKDCESLKAVLNETGMSLNNFVLNSSDGGIGGFLVKREDRAEYLKRLELLIPKAKLLGCSMLITCAGNEIDVDRSVQRQAMVETLKEAGPIAQAGGITLVVEPLNSLVDHPGYFLDSCAEAADVIGEVGHSNVKLLFDVYHMQIMQGNILAFIEKNLDIIGHFHSAGVPGRGELYNGELNYPFILKKIKQWGYDGRFGLEYFPTIESGESLVKIREYLEGAL